MKAVPMSHEGTGGAFASNDAISVRAIGIGVFYFFPQN